MPFNMNPSSARNERVEWCSLETAESCLIEYADEHDIDLDRLPSQNIENFIETIRYTPPEIQTEVIAEQTGITRGLYIRQRATITPSQSLSFQDVFAQIESVTSSPSFEPQAEPVMFSSTSEYRESRKPRRSEKDMMSEIVRGKEFPRPNFKDWSSSRELQAIINDWFRNIEYKDNWIFSRREREGFNRRNVGFFNLDDVMSRMTKRRNGHQLDTEKSKFYDWKLGGTDWTLRLELYQHEQHYFLISRYIHKPSNIEIRYNVRYWSVDRFKVVDGLLADTRYSEEVFERVFGSTNENSPYYVAPYQGDEDMDSDNFYHNPYDEDSEIDEDWDSDED